MYNASNDTETNSRYEAMFLLSNHVNVNVVFIFCGCFLKKIPIHMIRVQVTLMCFHEFKFLLT